MEGLVMVGWVFEVARDLASSFPLFTFSAAVMK